jgi:hypothetical protein
MATYDSSALPQSDVSALPIVTPYNITSYPEAAPELGEQSSVEPAKPAKRRLKRHIASCEQCRARRVRCNRLNPCDACIKRKEVCLWVAAKPLAVSKAPSIARDEGTATALETGVQSDREVSMETKIQHLEATIARLQLEAADKAHTASSGRAGDTLRSDTQGNEVLNSPTAISQVPKWLQTDQTQLVVSKYDAPVSLTAQYKQRRVSEGRG